MTRTIRYVRLFYYCILYDSKAIKLRQCERGIAIKTLYMSDMDGTLLNNDGAVSQKSRETINRLVKRGMLFSVATARSLMSVAEILENVDLSAPAVLMNGVFIYDFSKKKAVKYYEISNNQLKSIIGIFEKHNKSPFLFLFGDDGLLYESYTDLKLKIHKDFYEARKKMFDGRFKKVEKLAAPPRQHAVFISLSDTYEDLKPIYEQVVKIDGITASFYADTYTEYWFLEVYNAQASKANGAEFVKNYVGADKIIAFGDNRNDIILFSYADEKYAVENAVDELKVCATSVINSNENDGVADFLEQNFD